jgi:glycosyltransferase involved in cell wall biosynthesis
VGRLAADAPLRERMGRAARARYLEKFTPERMADGVAAMFATLAARRAVLPRAPGAVPPHPGDAHALAPRPSPRRLPHEPLRIAVIGSVLAPFDAISNDLVRKVRFLRETPGWQVSVITGHNARSDIDAKVVPRVSDLLLASEFRDADVIIYHFGIYYPLFDAILIGNDRARQAVVFHNITPLEHAPPGARPVIEKSFAQLENLRVADAIWPDSRENLETLLDRGFDPRNITIQPLAVDRPQRQGIRKPNGESIQILFIGRIVPSKGIQDLVEALAMLETGSVRVQVKVVGNIEGAEPAFRESLLARVAALGIAERIEFVGAVSDDERDSLLAASHILAIPSYHEGFCVPVIEALRAGMLPVVYSAHNLRWIADGLCVSAPPGDVAAFAAALASAVIDMAAVLADPATATLRLERGAMSVAEFESAVAAHLDQFEPDAAAQSLRARVNELLELP